MGDGRSIRIAIRDGGAFIRHVERKDGRKDVSQECVEKKQADFFQAKTND